MVGVLCFVGLRCDLLLMCFGGGCNGVVVFVVCCLLFVVCCLLFVGCCLLFVCWCCCCVLVLLLLFVEVVC